MSLESLPDEKIIEIALFLPLSGIYKLCLTNKRFNDIICDNDYFWREKFQKDYGKIEWEGNWKELYMNFGNVWAFGENHYSQLGIGHNEDTDTPTLIPDIKAKRISTGQYNSAIIDNNDDVWIWGHINSGIPFSNS